MDSRIALFVDHENIEIGTLDSLRKPFDPQRVLDFLNEEGQVWVANAYSDWSRYTRARHRYAETGFKLFDRPRRMGSDKNGTDIQMAVDMTDLCHRQKEINTFVLVAGDSDYLPVVRLLREYGKQVIVIANNRAASPVLVRNCTQFIAYEALVSKQDRGEGASSLDDNKRMESTAVEALKDVLARHPARNDEGGIRVNSLKDLIANRLTDFNEKQLGYKNFGAFLDAHVGKFGFRRVFRADNQPILIPLDAEHRTDDPEPPRPRRRPPSPSRDYPVVDESFPVAPGERLSRVTSVSRVSRLPDPPTPEPTPAAPGERPHATTHLPVSERAPRVATRVAPEPDTRDNDADSDTRDAESPRPRSRGTRGGRARTRRTESGEIEAVPPPPPPRSRSRAPRATSDDSTRAAREPARASASATASKVSSSRSAARDDDEPDAPPRTRRAAPRRKTPERDT